MEISGELKQIWLSTKKSNNKCGLIIAREDIQTQLKLFLGPIVESRYPKLANNGT